MGKKGFSILELVIVIVVMGISSMGLVVVIQQVVRNIHKPLVIATATGLAEKEAERLLRLSFANTVAESSQNYGGNFSGYTHSTTVTNVDSNNKIVDVSIGHAAIGSLHLGFLRTNY